MEILRRSREDLSKKDLYFLLTDKSIKKMTDLAGKTIDIVDYVIYEDLNRTTEEMHKIISIKTPDGAYASNSVTFIECFEQIISCFGEDFKTISVFENTSNRGRKFLQCSYVA